MKKLYALTALWLIFIFPVSAELPESVVNFGVGAGMNYGGIGTKTVIGYKNSGFMVGLGAIPGGLMGFEVGGQLSSEWFFINLGYGVAGTYKINNGPEETYKSWNAMVGGMIGIGAQKRLFIDIGVGHTFATQTIRVGPFDLTPETGVNFLAGVGYRIGTATKKQQ